jgi:NAD(P)H-flavin reductase
VRRQRVDQHTGRITHRTTTVRKKLFAANRGFVTVNDAPAMASQLARYFYDYSPRATRRAQTGSDANL